MKPHIAAIDLLTEERQMSRAKVASGIGISAPYWSQVLNGHRPAKAWMLTKAAEVLRCPVAAITVPEPEGATRPPARGAA